MILAIDAGNTNVVFSIFTRNNKIVDWREETKKNFSSDDWFVWLNQLMKVEKIDLESINKVVIACVVPPLLPKLEFISKEYFNCDPIVIQKNADLGIDILIDQPEIVGADCLANTVAAKIYYSTPAIIVDFGTATTFDIVDGLGNYYGGVIIAGVNLSIDALHSISPVLPNIDFIKPKKVIGNDSISAMQSGIYWGYISKVEGIIKKIKREFGSEMNVIATGGFASVFSEDFSLIDIVDKDLTLKGLLEVSKRSK
tara:strand:+ start:1220 stop:1984 length:765 start_codon:yes stop_codon:yes gene_type:complete